VKCTDLYRQLAEHGEGLLDKADCAAIEQHLRECSPCGDLRRDLEALARLCRESTRPRMPESVRRRIEKLLQAAV
jgi:hypothetical protein